MNRKLAEEKIRQLSYSGGEEYKKAFLFKLSKYELAEEYNIRYDLTDLDNIVKDAVDTWLSSLSGFKYRIGDLEITKKFLDLAQELIINERAIVLLDYQPNIRFDFEVIPFTRISELTYNKTTKRVFGYKDLDDNYHDLTESVAYYFELKTIYYQLCLQQIVVFNLTSILNYSFYKDTFTTLVIGADLENFEGVVDRSTVSDVEIQIGPNRALFVGNSRVDFISPDLNNLNVLSSHIEKIKANMKYKAGLLTNDAYEKAQSGVSLLIKNEKLKKLVNFIQKNLQEQFREKNIDITITELIDFDFEELEKDIKVILENPLLQTPTLLKDVVAEYFAKKYKQIDKDKLIAELITNNGFYNT